MNLKSRAREKKKKEDIEWDLSQTFTQFKNACIENNTHLH